FFQAEDGIRDWSVTGVQTCALPIYEKAAVSVVLDLVRAASALRVLLGTGALLDRLEIASALSQTGMAVTGFENLTAQSARDPFRSEERRVGEGGSGGRGAVQCRQR